MFSPVAVTSVGPGAGQRPLCGQKFAAQFVPGRGEVGGVGGVGGHITVVAPLG